MRTGSVIDVLGSGPSKIEKETWKYRGIETLLLAITKTLNEKTCNCSWNIWPYQKTNVAFEFEIPSKEDDGGTGIVSMRSKSLVFCPKLLEEISESSVICLNDEAHFPSFDVVDNQTYMTGQRFNPAFFTRPLHSVKIWSAISKYRITSLNFFGDVNDVSIFLNWTYIIIRISRTRKFDAIAHTTRQAVKVVRKMFSVRLTSLDCGYLNWADSLRFSSCGVTQMLRHLNIIRGL